MRSKTTDCLPNLRSPVVEFLIQSTHKLCVSPIVKYTALSLFADRFYTSLSRFVGANSNASRLLVPIREANLQLFVLVSIWISSKIHFSRPLLLKILKPLGDASIKEEHFTKRDYLEAEVLFLQVLNYEIGAGNLAFLYLQDLLLEFKNVAKVGELVNFGACMDIMDLLYEREETAILYSSPRSLAASTLVAAYVITVPKQRWEFPVLPWVKYAASCKEEDILEVVRDILNHVFASS